MELLILVFVVVLYVCGAFLGTKTLGNRKIQQPVRIILSSLLIFVPFIGLMLYSVVLRNKQSFKYNA